MSIARNARESQTVECIVGSPLYPKGASHMMYSACEMMVRAGRFVDGLKAAGVAFFAGVPVELLYGCYCTDGV